MKVLSKLIVMFIMLFASSASADDVLITGQGLPENYIEAKSKLIKSGPTLLFSDSPEMVYENGVLYEDTVSGDIRIFFHHVNAMDINKKIAVLIKNDTELRPVNYQFTKKGIGVDSWNYMYAGKTSQEVYFNQDFNDNGTLGFGQSMEILTGRGMILNPGKLLVGTVDLHLSRPAKISVLMCDIKSDIELFSANAKRLPMDEHPLRGTFFQANWQYTVKKPIVNDKQQAVMLELASDEQGFAAGVDATTGKNAVNYGNYGILYTVDFAVKGKNNVNLYLNPLGGLFTGYCILESENERKVMALPQDKLAIGESYDDLLKIAELKAGKYRLIWSPPGASNLPVRLYWM